MNNLIWEVGGRNKFNRGCSGDKFDWEVLATFKHPIKQNLPIDHVFIVAKYVFKQTNKNLPSTFQGYFSTNTQVHTHNTRLSYKLHVKRPNSTQGVKTIKSTGVTIFNKLPTRIINCTSLNRFKRRTKKHL